MDVIFVCWCLFFYTSIVARGCRGYAGGRDSDSDDYDNDSDSDDAVAINGCELI